MPDGTLQLRSLSRHGPLAAILLTALGLRLWSIRHGLPALLDPDELMFELGAYRMLEGGRLNPEWFGHPATVTMYVLALVDIAVFVTGWIGGAFASIDAFADAIFFDPGLIILPGRIVMALFGVACVALTYRLTAQLFDRQSAMVAAAIVAVSPVHVALSQIIRSDMMATCFMLAAMLAALRIARHGRFRDEVLASFCVALAVTTKWPFALSFLAIAGAFWCQARDGRLHWAVAATRVCRCLVFSILMVLAISPYLLIDHQTVLSNLQGERQSHHLGATGGTFLENAWWYLSGPLARALGLGGLALAFVGMAQRRARSRFWPIAGTVALAFLILFFAQTLVWERWVLPIVPLAAIGAGFGCVSLWRRTIPALPGHWQSLATACLALALILPPLLTTMEQAQERIHDTRLLATRWLMLHASPDSKVLVEHFAFDLARSPLDVVFPIGVGGCFDARALLNGKIDYGKVEALRGGNSNLDYAAVPPSMRATCKADYALLTQYARYETEADRYPAKVRAYRQLIAAGSVVARFTPERGRTGGTETVIVQFDR